MRSVLALTLALAALAGCGGGGDAGEQSEKDAFVAEANRICREGEQRTNEITREHQEEIESAASPQEQRDAVAGALEDTARGYEPYLARLRDLEAPSDLAGEWSTFLDGIEEAFGLIPELAAATRAQDREQLDDLAAEFTRIARDTRPFAESGGLDDCLPDEEG
jgi:hypothetical protein